MQILEVTYSNAYGYTVVKGFTQGNYKEDNAIYTDLSESEVIALIVANPEYAVIGF